MLAVSVLYHEAMSRLCLLIMVTHTRAFPSFSFYLTDSRGECGDWWGIFLAMIDVEVSSVGSSAG